MIEGDRDSVNSQDAVYLRDVSSVMSEFPHGDDHPGKHIPTMSLTETFDNIHSSEMTQGLTDGPASSIGGSMKVYLRVRPVETEGGESTIVVTSSTAIRTTAPEASKRNAYAKMDERHYTFSQVFGSAVDQYSIYETVAEPLVDRFLKGENCILFACE
jgi:Kinesin motor domain